LGGAVHLAGGFTPYLGPATGGCAGKKGDPAPVPHLLGHRDPVPRKAQVMGHPGKKQSYKLSGVGSISKPPQPPRATLFRPRAAQKN